MNRTAILHGTLIFLAYWLFFLFFQSTSIYGGDAGDLVSAAYTGGIAHPPGYPLYSFIGWVLGHIPFSTVAWRVGLISSLSSAGALMCLSFILYRLTRSSVVSILAPAILATTYVYWLYASVPEVFGLLSFFCSLLLAVGYSYMKDPTTHKLYLLFFIAGLSLTHHHIVLFIFPSVALCILYAKKSLIRMSLQTYLIAIMCSLLGLLPYTWAVIAGIKVAPVVWDDPVTLSNLYRLMSRADYGSFQSGIVYGEHIQSRLLQFVALFDYYLQDFTLIGIFLALGGMISLYKASKSTFAVFFIGWLLTGPGYFFYASYLYSTRFHIATAERFVLPSYLFMTIFIGYGIHSVMTYITHTQHIRTHLRGLLHLGVIGIFALIPLSLIFINYPKISILKNDRTAENFAHDILRDVEPESIVFLQGDHPVFNSQYVYYTSGYRSDVQLIHLSKLLNGTGARHIRKYYPRYILSEKGDRIESFVHDLDSNYERFPIYANIPLDLIPEGYRWVPLGLLFRLYKTEDVPSYPDVFVTSNNVWKSFQHPLDGSLGKYPNLMLSNIADYYRDASVRRGLYSAEHGRDYTHAYEYYTYALKLDPQSGAIRYLLGETSLSLGKCSQAKKYFDAGYKHRTDDQMLYIDSMISLYDDCYKDTSKAAIWKKKKTDFANTKEQQLKAL